MKAAIYARFSTELQSKDSIHDQYRVCERLALAQGFEVVARFGDEGISGGTVVRDGYQTLLTAARAGEFGVIVVEDLSRLWRSRAEFGPRSAEFEDLGLQLVTCVGDDTRRDGWGLMLGIKSAIAESQRKEISYRTKRGLEGLALAGKSTGGRCYGFGSLVDGRRQGAEIDPVEASVVRQIFDRRLAGLSYAAIAAELRKQGVPTVGGGLWSRFSVRTILSNPRYAGDGAWGRTETKGGARDSRQRRKVARPDGPLVRRVIDHIVDPKIVAMVNG